MVIAHDKHEQVKLSEIGKIDAPPVSVFNSVVNACEICEEQELTLLVLEAMKKTHKTDGNIITFNIALKRLAKMGNSVGCEGIIIGMLENGVEPSVVSYTTAIAACAQEPKNPVSAYEWLRRMRSRNVSPNVITYNTALACCLDGKMESTALASKMCTEMMNDVNKQIQDGIDGNLYTSVLPDSYTKTLTRQLMKQLRDNWRKDEIDVQVAKATLRKPMLSVVDFHKSDSLRLAKDIAAKKKTADVTDATARYEAALEASSMTHRRAEV